MLLLLALQNELAKAEGIKERLRATTQVLEREKGDILREHDTVRLQLKKALEKVQSIQDENASLQSKLADAQFLLKAKQVEYERELAILKAEMVKMKTSKQDTAAMMHESVRDKAVTDRKVEFLTHK